MTELGLPEFVDVVEIGRGGFGIVYRATQEAFGRTVALKVLSVLDSETVRRFERERLALGPVSNHPNIVQVFASGLTAAGQPYLAMEFMGGGSLEDRIERSGPLESTEVLDIAVKLAGALETAHRAGITHRDLKPANILLSEFGEPHLADFGIASIEGGDMTRSGVITASINYAAPEVLEGRRPGTRGDIYSFGATLHCLLAGRAPFASRDASEPESIVALALRVATGSLPDLRPIGVAPGLADVIERAMAKDPDQRYESAEQLGRALQDVQRSLGHVPTALPLAGDSRAPTPQDDGATRVVSMSTPPPFGAAATPPATAAPPVTAAPSPLPPLAPAAEQRAPAKSRLPLAIGAVALVAAAAVGAFALGGGFGSDDANPVAAGAAPAGSDDAVAPAEPQPDDALPVADDLGDVADDSLGPDVPETGAEPTYTPIEGDWESLPPMNVERQQLSAVTTPQGKIWMAGGLDAFAYATTTVEFYDPLLRLWTMCDCDLPLALNHHMATYYRDAPVVLGGWIGDAENIKVASSDRVLMLDGNEWIDLPPLLEPRVAGAAVTVGDWIIVTGGQDAAGNMMTTTEIFDGNEWRWGADLPVVSEHLAAATDGRMVYVVGGRQLPAGSAGNLADLQRYDPATDTWEARAPMPTARGGLAATWANGSLIALGGEGPTSVFDEVEQYDPTTDSWSELAPLPGGRHGLAAGVFRRTLYAIGGADDASHIGSTDAMTGLPLG